MSTDKTAVPTLSKPVSRFLNQIGKISKPVNFMGLEIKINKLTVLQIEEVQKLSESATGKESDSQDQYKLLQTVLQFGAIELADITVEELKQFPLDDLQTLTNSILEYSGLGK